MEWINSLAREVLSGSLVAAALAAGFVCWRTRSLHAVYMRILHLFVPMEHIKCPVINEYISDKSSVIAFRMAYGIQCRTLKDAKAVSAFAAERNIPLDLIGEVGYRFDTLKLQMRSKKDIAPVLFPLSFVAILASIACIAMSLMVAFSSNLLISLKETDTWYWIAANEATSLRRDAQWEPFVLTRAQCSSDGAGSKVKDATAIRDLAILCEVWADSDLKIYLQKELPKQRSAFFVVSGLIGGVCLMLFLQLLSWFAEKELRRLIQADGEQERVASA